MTLNTWFSVLAFFVLAAPGLLYDQLSARKAVRRKESAFTEIGRIALVSTVCSAVAFVVLLVVAGLARCVHWHPMPDLSAMIRSGSSYITEHIISVSIAAVLGLTVSMLAAWGAFEFVNRKNPAKITYASAWAKLIREELPTPTTAVHVRATVESGAIWYGRVSHFSPDMEVADREIVLCPPLYVQNPHGDLSELPAKWQRVVLRGSEITTLAVRYENPPAASNG
ncbi:hypothetical protein D4768_30400 (plasmid) [Rhodococcus erythropolis]|uniref:DUF6338 family protein n=1 Tax=Rhodococcus erythropolis TaxID=1833 RepID=UPI001F1D294D|nr:DUF6338 family protein [Rhodococcus erythropolis]UJC82134.1 hypothetical protein D4768_30400 [Rhodococcus erythropolis]